MLCYCVKSQHINNGEYFFDTDPGPGNGFPIGSIINGDTVNFSKNISVSGLGLGYHLMYVRLRSDNGIWSLPDSRLIIVYDTLNVLPQLLSHAPPLKKCEYFFDNDPGSGKGISFYIPNWPDTINTLRAISIAGLNKGFHLLYTRIQDSSGNWSMIESRLFTVIDTVEPINVVPVQSSRLVKYQYRFDTITNPVYTIAFNQADSVNALLSIPVSSLSEGMHKIIFSLLDLAGKKSFPDVQLFKVCSSLPDAPVINGNTILNICYGASVTLSATSAFGSSIVWHGPNGYISTAANITINSINAFNTGNYYAHSVTGSGNCDTSTAAFITVNGNASPTAHNLTITGSSTFCSGDNIRLNTMPQNGYSYRWLFNEVNTANNSDTLNSLQVTINGTYNVRVTNTYGCSVLMHDTSIALSAPPVTGMIAGKSNVLINAIQNYRVTNTPGSSYHWFVYNGIIKNGNGADSISVEWSSSIGSAYIKLVETNAAGCNGDTITLAINLLGIVLSVNPTHILALKSGSNTIVNIICNNTWTASSGQPWILLSKLSAIGNDSINVTILPNPTFVIRSAIITFSSGLFTQYLTVSQNQTLSDSLSLSADTIFVPYAGNNRNVGVYSNRNWTVSSNQSWALVNTPNGSGNSSFYVYTPNNTGAERSGLITVMAGSVTKIIYLLQRSNSSAVLNNLKDDIKYIRVYPNPSSSSVTVTSNKFDITEIKLYDITGQIVYKLNIHQTQEFIADLSGLPNGIYFMHVTDEKGFINIIKIVLTK